MCIKPTEEDFTTIYHELGHIYYYLAYGKQPPLFQGGANDGFHEAIGDTIVLAMTPKYLARSEEHTSELQSLMRISYAVFCLKQKTTTHTNTINTTPINK